MCCELLSIVPPQELGFMAQHCLPVIRQRQYLRFSALTHFQYSTLQFLSNGCQKRCCCPLRIVVIAFARTLSGRTDERVEARHVERINAFLSYPMLA